MKDNELNTLINIFCCKHFNGNNCNKGYKWKCITDNTICGDFE